MASFETIADKFNAWRTGREITRGLPSLTAGHFTNDGVDLDKIIVESAHRIGLT